MGEHDMDAGQIFYRITATGSYDPVNIAPTDIEATGPTTVVSPHHFIIGELTFRVSVLPSRQEHILKYGNRRVRKKWANKAMKIIRQITKEVC